MIDFIIIAICFFCCVLIFLFIKKLYRQRRTLLLMPLVFTPVVLGLLLVVARVSWQDYIGETHWLLWLLGPSTRIWRLSAATGCRFLPAW